MSRITVKAGADFLTGLAHAKPVAALSELIWNGFDAKSKRVEIEIKTDLASIVKVIRENTDVPCAIGFGISTPKQAKKMADISDGAIVGSAIIKIIDEYGEASPKYVGEYVKAMKDAL